MVLAFTAGSMLVMWLGDQITEKGVGNGISIILFAGILSRLPASIATLIAYTQLDPIYYFAVPLVLVLFAVIIYFIVVMTTAERRIPVQYAKRVVGRKMYGGQNSHIPLKVTLTGVLPIIFAGAILAIPSTIALSLIHISACRHRLWLCGGCNHLRTHRRQGMAVQRRGSSRQQKTPSGRR